MAKSEKSEKRAKSVDAVAKMRAAPKRLWKARVLETIARMQKRAGRIGKQLGRCGPDWTVRSEELKAFAAGIDGLVSGLVALPEDFRPPRPKSVNRGPSFAEGDRVTIRPKFAEKFLWDDPSDAQATCEVLKVLGHKAKIQSASGETTMIGLNQIVRAS